MIGSRKFKWFVRSILLTALLTAGILGFAFYHSTASIHELLTENKRLSKAIHNLTREEQIGYAVLESQIRDEFGNLISNVRFVQTAPGDPQTIVSEQQFKLQGDVIHFDALIVKFTDEFVKDGKERALYLWRRIYGEYTAPADGQIINSMGLHPKRYESITKSLGLKNRYIFWGAIWTLTHDTKRLEKYGVTAVYGNAIYTLMQPGKVYLFKINSSGQIYPEVVNTY